MKTTWWKNIKDNIKDNFKENFNGTLKHNFKANIKDKVKDNIKDSINFFVIVIHLSLIHHNTTTVTSRTTEKTK